MSYETAVACARAMGRVRSLELASRTGIDWRIAVAYLARMERDGIVSRMDARGWRDAGATQSTQPKHAAQETTYRRKYREVDPGQGHVRLTVIRHLIARELDPDLSDDVPVRVLKTELFKRIWPQIDDLMRSAA